jgi:hypothetical protein
MTKVEDKIKSSLSLLQKSCKSFPSCADFCYCRALAEVFGYHTAIIPGKYANLNISDFTGKVNGKQVVATELLSSAVYSFMMYCFDDAKLSKDTPRSKLNSMSAMDRRFLSGCSVVIHGDVKGSFGRTGSGALGRSLLAALVLKEAIWRRMFKENEAITYRFASIHDLIGEVFDKDHSDSTWLTDWLVIDDVANDGRRAMGSALDQIISRRRTLNLPTILVLQFDASSVDVDLSSVIGHMASKLYADTDLCFQMRLG